MLLQCDQQLHTLRYNNVLIRQIPHVTGITVPSPGGAHWYTTVVQPLYHSQCTELSQVRQCMSIEMDMYTVTGAACRSRCIHGTFVCAPTSKEMLMKAVFREACP
jgi:hypothetical protein